MKKLLLYLLFFFFSLPLARGQNYQTLKSNQTHYFSQSSDLYALATRTDSIETFGGDSIFYSFKTARRDDSSAFCEFTLQAPWYGKRVLIKNNGLNEYYNRFDEKISFNTQADLLDSMLVYTYSSGERIHGIVSDHDTMSFLGFHDSVKTIVLHDEMPNSTFDNQELKISKNHGWVAVLPFFSFPSDYYPDLSANNSFINQHITTSMDLIGMENPRVGITRLTNKEVYEMEVNDEIRRTGGSNNVSSGWPGNFTSWKRIEKLIQKTPLGNDKIKLTFHRQYGYNNPQIDTISITVKIDSEYYNSYLPEEYYFRNDFQSAVTHNFITTGTCNRILEGSIGHSLDFTTDSSNTTINDSTCIVYNLETNHYIQGVLQGLGPAFYYAEYFGGGYEVSNGNINSFSLKGDTCGVLWIFGENEYQSPSFTLFPNPSSSFIQIESDSEYEKLISIYDLNGRLILEKQMTGQSFRLELPDLRNGIYILELKEENYSSHQKIMIRQD